MALVQANMVMKAATSTFMAFLQLIRVLKFYV
jgi:hypothetical protein